MRKLKLFSGVIALAVLMLGSTSCGDDHDLLFIQVIPGNVFLTTQAPTAQFIANGVFNRGPDEDITSSVTWASAQPTIASVNSTGLVTAGTVCGSTVITASLDGKTDTASVNVSLDVCP